jgi:hypothetical protein
MAVFIHKKGIVIGQYTRFSTVGDFLKHHPNVDKNTVVEGQAVAGQLWDGKKLSNPPPTAVSADPRDHNLSPRQFNRFAALHGYDDAIDAVLSALKSADRETYAKIKGDVIGAKVFHFEVILGLIANPRLKSLIPSDVDVSESTMTKGWMIAKDY